MKIAIEVGKAERNVASFEEISTFSGHISITTESIVLQEKRDDVEFKELLNAVCRIEIRRVEAEIFAFFGDKVMAMSFDNHPQIGCISGQRPRRNLILVSLERELKMRCSLFVC